MIWNQYPYLNLNDFNLDYILKSIGEITKQLNEFVVKYQIKFADPIGWNISTQYEANTIVINGNIAYLSKVEVPAGVSIDNTDYWLMVFDFGDFLTKIAKDICATLIWGVTSEVEIPMNSWFMKDYELYIAIADIHVNDVVDETNSKRFTLEELWNAFLAKYAEEFEAYRTSINDNISSYKTQINTEVSNFENSVPITINNAITDLTENIEAQLAEAIAGVTVDSEVINARIGADGYTYPTLGVAVRSQFRALGYYDARSYNQANVVITGGGNYVNFANSTSFAIPIKRGDNIRIQASATEYLNYCFLDSYTLPVVDNTPADFSDDYPSRIGISAGTAANYTVHDNAAYLWVLFNDNGTDRTPQHLYINGIDYLNTYKTAMSKISAQAWADKYPISRALKFDEILRNTAINEHDDIMAHASNIAIDENGLGLLIYYGNKDSYVEDYSDNSDAFVKIRKFYNDAPEDIETLLTISRGWECDKFILARGCASNPNIIYMGNGDFKCYFSGYFTDKLTSVEDFGYIAITWNITNGFTMNGGFIEAEKVNIVFSGNDYWASNVGMTSLYAALGETVTNPYVIFAGNFAYHQPSGYYYTTICGIYYYGVLVRTNDFINFEFVYFFNNGTHVEIPEIAIEFQRDNARLAFIYRCNDVGNSGCYWGIYTLATATATYKDKLTDSYSKPACIKDYFRNVIFIYNVPEEQRPVFLRNGMKASMFDEYHDTTYDLCEYHNYPMAIHYPATIQQGVLTWFSYTSGKSGARVGTDYDTIQLGCFAPIYLNTLSD